MPMPFSRKQRRGRADSKESLVSRKDLPKEEILILVMGPTGSGKSSFINMLLQNHPGEKMKVGHELASCTSTVEERTVIFNDCVALRDYRITLVDTPGFDDTYETDMDILKRIASWLDGAYREKRILGGIVYLHDISFNRFSGTCAKNLKLFSAMCGVATLEKVVIGTTHWKKIENTPGVGQTRTEELRKKYWKEMLDKGCRSMSFADSYHSALSFLEIFTSRISEEVFMQIQRELVDERKLLPETAAARELSAALEYMFQLKKEAAALEAKVASGGSAQDIEQLEKTKKTMEAILGQIQQLKTPFSRKLKRFFGLT